MPSSPVPPTPSAQDREAALRYFTWWGSVAGGDRCTYEKHEYESRGERCLTCFAQALAAARAAGAAEAREAAAKIADEHPMQDLTAEQIAAAIRGRRDGA